jgi:DNA-binding CsgD family transcriptional regulator
LYEREAEVEAILAAARVARDGRGSVVVVSGAPGIGKSAVLAAIARETPELRRLTARGGELERQLPLGVVRQLLESTLTGARRQVPRRLLGGAAGVAAILEGRASGADADWAAILTGLHRLVRNLATERPLLVEVDDVQWADAASLRVLAFLARRLGELPALVLLGRRTGEPATDDEALRAIEDEPLTRELPLAPLSIAAASTVVRELAGSGAEESFSHACHSASAGNPFVLRELVKALAEAGVPPDLDGAASVLETGPPEVARWVLARLQRLSPQAGELARAVAILGHDCELGHAARLARLSLEDAETALDTLAEAELLTALRPIDFVHPVVRAAVRETMAPGRRSGDHRRAARLLREDRAPADHVAAHLLATHPGQELWVAEALLDGARSALAKGAPDVAAGHLHRALAEPPPRELRPALLRALGTAELRLGLGTANDRFLAAVDDTDDARERGHTLVDMAFGPDVVKPAAIERIRRTIDDLEPVDSSLALMLRAQLLEALDLLEQPLEEDRRHAARVLAAHPENTRGTRLLAGALASQAVLQGERERSIVALTQRAVADDDAYDADLDAGYALLSAIGALSFTDADVALAERRLTQAADWAQRRGSVIAAIPLYARAHLRTRAGRLTEAERDARLALDLATRAEIEHMIAMAVGALLRALLERGHFAAAEEVLEQHRFARGPESSKTILLTPVRALLHLARGRPSDALGDAIAVGRVADARHIRNPAVVPWRSRAALALIALGRPTEARTLAEQELAIAQRTEVGSSIGAATRVVALTNGADIAVPLLYRAVAILERTPAPLELARALTDLGAALRRGGQRQAAREPLTRALDIAHRHGATPLANTARTELLAAGARPRRTARSGLDALTPSERRIAELAADGLSNAEIAARLFITVKTTEHHLSTIYRKLDIRSRRELPATLAPTQHENSSVESNPASQN